MSEPPAMADAASGVSQTDRTYEKLKTAIIRNQLPPGTPLSVPELARQLQVSRTPVREAVLRLIYEGLATNVLHRGAEVSKVDIDDLRELYVVRELLEGLAARLATERLDADRLAELQAILSDHEDVLATGGDVAAHVEMDMRFHRTLRDIAANPHLTGTLEPIAGRSHLALHSLWRSDDAPHLAMQEHRSIVEAMTTGDPELAEVAARRHISRLRVRLAQATAREDEPDRGGRRRKISLAP